MLSCPTLTPLPLSELLERFAGKRHPLVAWATARLHNCLASLTCMASCLGSHAVILDTVKERKGSGSIWPQFDLLHSKSRPPYALARCRPLAHLLSHRFKNEFCRHGLDELKTRFTRGGKRGGASAQLPPFDPTSAWFDVRQHLVLCEELKHLYVALTRARRRDFFFDQNLRRREALFRLLLAMGPSACPGIGGHLRGNHGELSAARRDGMHGAHLPSNPRTAVGPKSLRRTASRLPLITSAPFPSPLMLQR